MLSYSKNKLNHTYCYGYLKLIVTTHSHGVLISSEPVADTRHLLGEGPKYYREKRNVLLKIDKYSICFGLV